MNDLLVNLFRAIYGFMAWAAIFTSLVIGAIRILTASGPMQTPIGYAIMIGGPVFAILIFGTVALMIQNNDLLREIAGRKDGAEAPPKAPEKAAKEPWKRGEPSLRGKK